jgi:hypothetical protein
MNGWLEDGEPCLADQRWPMAPAHLLPLERWLWWEQLWAAHLRGPRWRVR